MIRLIRAIITTIAARDVLIGRAERIAVPGQWKARREQGRTIIEIFNEKDN